MPSRLTPLPGFSLKQVEVHSVVVDMPEIISLWKERFGVTEQELSEAVRVAGASASKVETYLKSKDAR
jgi:hypothetical protein